MATSSANPTLPTDGRPLRGIARLKPHLGHSNIVGVYHGNSNFLLHFPTKDLAPPPDPTFVRGGNFKSPSFVSARTPYIMFIPAIKPWYGPLFSRLNYSFRNLPIVECEDGKWGLPTWLIDEWWALEANLRKAMQAMQDLNSHAGTQHVLPFGWPNRWGYAKTFRTEQIARIVIHRSIRGFLPLIGLVSFYIWCMELREVQMDADGTIVQTFKDVPDWREHVCRRHVVKDKEGNESGGIHRQWLNDLIESAAGDLSIPRIGGIVDFTAAPYSSDNELCRELQYLIPAIIATHLPIPLYMVWGRIKTYPAVPVPSGLDSMQFVPTLSELQYLHFTLPGDTVFFSRWSATTRPNGKVTMEPLRLTEPFVVPLPLTSAPPPAPAPPVAQVFPPVERYSGQRQGEDMAAFFLRRKQKNAATLACETSQKAQSRAQKEAHALKGLPPGHNGARVYVWDGLIRRAGGRHRYENLWEEYGPEQRRYDSFHDEWDLCEDFGRLTEPEEDWDSGYDDADMDDSDIPSGLLPEDAIQEAAAHSSEADLVRIHNITTESALEKVNPYSKIGLTFKEMVHMRYGCTVTKHNLDTPPADPPAALAKKLVGDLCVDITNDSTHLNQFRSFLARCRTADSPFEIPRQLLDFHQKESELYSDWTVQVRREVLNDEMFYVISAKEQQPSGFFILVNSATTAMEIVRQGWGPSLRDVAENLLSRGISFLTCFRSVQTAPLPRFNTRSRGYSGLGYRPPNYKPDLRDYGAYVSIRNRFLHSSRGRAALLYGGIVGRLARSEVSNEEVLRGSSDDALIEGICLWDGRSPFAYWDDFLTAQEIDLICGVYHIATGQRDRNLLNGEQTQTVSWWPKPLAFNASGNNIGWWTPMWESWYQKRLAQLESGSGVLSTHTQWKHNIRFERNAKPYTEALEKCAARIIDVLRP